GIVEECLDRYVVIESGDAQGIELPAVRNHVHHGAGFVGEAEIGGRRPVVGFDPAMRQTPSGAVEPALGVRLVAMDDLADVDAGNAPGDAVNSALGRRRLPPETHET